MVLRTRTNHENTLEKGMLEHRQADRGRAILAPCEPENEYDLDVPRHNELLPLLRGGEHAKEFR